MGPGEIYMADFPEAGPHPVIVVSREDLNRGHWGVVPAEDLLRAAMRPGLAGGARRGELDKGGSAESGWRGNGWTRGGA